MRILLIASLLMSLIATAHGDITVFDHDFTNATPGTLGMGGGLGTPTAGSITATGGFITANTNIVQRAYTTGNNGASNPITTIADGSFNDVGTPGGNIVTANLASAAAVTGTLGAGQTTQVDFSFAGFGNNNSTNFKYMHVVGLSTSGDEVFQLLWRSGNGSASRELYARELGEDNTTFAGGGFSSVDGTLALDDVSFSVNGTNTAARPSGVVNVSVTIDELGWNVTAAPSGGGSTSIPLSGLGIASGATDLASIQFFTSTNAILNNQNNGFYLDNISVVTDAKVIPEPTAAVVLLATGLIFGRRRR